MSRFIHLPIPPYHLQLRLFQPEHHPLFKADGLTLRFSDEGKEWLDESGITLSMESIICQAKFMIDAVILTFDNEADLVHFKMRWV